MSGYSSYFCWCCHAALSCIILCLCFPFLCLVDLCRACKPLWFLWSSHGLVFTARLWAHYWLFAFASFFELPQFLVVLLIPLIGATQSRKNWFLPPSPLLSVAIQSTDKSQGCSAVRVSTLYSHGSPAAVGETLIYKRKAFTHNQADLL